jgi:hypothetical protein
MSDRYEVRSRCECQATLGATLDAEHLVLGGWCQRGGRQQSCPAIRLGAGSDRFDITWRCARCGRNTLRSFYAGALVAMADVIEPSDAAGPAEAASAISDERATV